jgi:subtilisin
MLMKGARRVAACTAAGLLAGLVVSGSGVARTHQSAAVPDKAGYIVVYDAGVNADAATDALERAQGFQAKFRYGTALKGFAAHLNAAQAAGISRNPTVKFIGNDGTVEAVGMVPIKPGETNPPGIRRIGAATNTQVHQPASGFKVAVIDTGSGPHTDIARTTKGRNCTGGPHTANDDNGHGTHVAGTIAAKNNGAGVVGVTPNTKIVSVKVLHANGSGTFAEVICGIDWVAANGPGTRKNIRVANMSLSGGGTDDGNCGNTNADAMHQAICGAVARGVTFVVAASNSAVNFANSVPAAYDEVLTVTAMTDTDGVPGGTGPAPACFPGNTDDSYATFSNFAVTASDQTHTIAAPGVCVLSTWLNNGYNTISGTSMASPHVAGTVALCIGNGPAPPSGPCAALTPAQIVQKLRSDAQAHATLANGFNGDPNHPVAGRYYGYLAWAGGY